MRSLVTVADARAGRQVDLLVEADAGLPVAALLDALRAEGLAGPGPLRRSGVSLDERAKLGEVLRDGLLLVSGGDAAGQGWPGGPSTPPAGPRAPGPIEEVELRIVGGPDAGRAVRLGPGRYLVGRA